MSEDRCACCGEIIPEGRMVCPNCQVSQKKKKKPDEMTRKKFNYATGSYLDIKAYTPYVDGIVGRDIKLTFKQKIKILSNTQGGMQQGIQERI